MRFQRVTVFFVFLFVSMIVFAGVNASPEKISTKEFAYENLSFNYISSDGSYWFDCKHEKGSQPHSWTVYCDRFVFKLHIMLREYHRENETVIEFHYWADEFKNLDETHTQSTWLTVDKNTKPKSLVGYLGFSKDAAQLRIGITL